MKSRFSLIEMLVVGSVLIVLLSLLATSLRSLIEKGRRVECLQNQRFIHLALDAYVEDNASWLPEVNALYKTGSGYAYLWNSQRGNQYFAQGRLLYGYVKHGEGLYTNHPEIFECPSQPYLDQTSERIKSGFEKGYTGFIGSTYSFNGSDQVMTVDRRTGKMENAVQLGALMLVDYFALRADALSSHPERLVLPHEGRGDLVEGFNATFFTGAGKWVSDDDHEFCFPGDDKTESNGWQRHRLWIKSFGWNFETLD